VDKTVRTVRESYADHPVMPVINGEAAYEMLHDKLPTKWTRQMFWLCMTNGAAGHTYGANGIWQVNRRGQPHGPLLVVEEVEEGRAEGAQAVQVEAVHDRAHGVLAHPVVHVAAAEVVARDRAAVLDHRQR